MGEFMKVIDWREKLEKFLSNFKYKDDLIGVLVCGSYITGHPTLHSDLDVHFVLNEGCDYRVRVTKIVDGLLIEGFVNTPQQIREYFKEDYNEIQQSSMNQFATGEIFLDKTGVIKKLKKEATKLIAKRFADVDNSISEVDKYAVWDMLDDLEDAYKEKRRDFDFVYYKNLDKLLSFICKFFKYPYGNKVIFRLDDAIIRKKYNLPEFEEREIGKMIKKAISTRSKRQKLNCFRWLSEKLWELTGGFDINTFDYKSRSSV